MSRRVRSRLLATALGLAMAGTAHAGRDCAAARPTVEAVTQGLALAQRTAAALDASGARVVVLARAGQDLQKYGLRWSHLGYAYRTPEGPWRVVHKLNRCGTAVAEVWRHGLGDFFLDGLWRHEAAWSVPAPAVQDRLMALLADPHRTLRLDTPAYSLVSHPWAQRYQQSNQWALETLAAAMEPDRVHDRSQAQAWLRLQGYRPTVLRLGPLTRLGGRIGSAHIAFDDHPPADRFADRIATVTVDSVFDWLQASGWGAAPVVLPVAPDDPIRRKTGSSAYCACATSY